MMWICHSFQCWPCFVFNPLATLGQSDNEMCCPTDHQCDHQFWLLIRLPSPHITLPLLLLHTCCCLLLSGVMSLSQMSETVWMPLQLVPTWNLETYHRETHTLYIVLEWLASAFISFGLSFLIKDVSHHKRRSWSLCYRMIMFLSFIKLCVIWLSSFWYSL